MRLTRIVFLSLIAGLICLFAVYWTGITVFAQDDATAPAPPAQAPARPKPAAKHKAQHRQDEAQPRQEEAQPRQEQAQPRQEQAQPNTAAAQAPPATIFDEHAREGKLVTCANVFGALGRGVAADSTYTVRTQWDSKVGDAHSVQSIVALTGGSANPAQRGAGVVFAAPIGHSCEGTLVRVTPTNDNCQTVATMLAKLNGQSSALGDLPLIALPNGAQVMLVPFGNACVAVTTLRASG